MKASSDKEEWDKQARNNAKTIEREIQNLKMSHWDMFQRKHKEFWIHAKQISNLFKTLKPILHEDRERLWSEFNNICEEVKQKQNEARQKLKRDSKQKRELVESKIKEGYNWGTGARNRDDLNKANSILKEALEWMKNGWEGFNLVTQVTTVLNEGKLTKEDNDFCWERWKEAKDAIKNRREELCQSNFYNFRSRASNTLDSAKYGDAREAKSNIKKIQIDMKNTLMNKNQYQEIRDLLDQAWQVASARLKQEYEEKQQRHKEWRNRMEDRIERWTELLEKNENVISRLERQIDECNDMERDAKSSDFASTVRGWIEEKRDKISSIAQTNRELEEKIRSVNNKLND